MRTLEQWLEYIELAHPSNIDMGLERVKQVANLLVLDFSSTTLITVAGTNGKGTTCRFIEQACLQNGLSVGTYSSPHILKFNERIRVNGIDVDDAAIINAFEVIDEARGNIALTYFEFATLCGFLLFAQANLDVCIIEVGLGGRLDATNIVDADIGIITSIGLDHQGYLGNTTELIAGEKAGIIKPKQKVVVGYAEMHDSVKQVITKYASTSLIAERDFVYDGHKDQVTFNKHAEEGQKLTVNLSEAKIPKQNVMTALACLYLLANIRKSVHPFLLSTDDIHGLIPRVSMPGRLQTLLRSPTILLDVAHNRAAAECLVRALNQDKLVTQAMGAKPKCHIVIGMLKEKNIDDTIAVLSEVDAHWYCVSLPTERGESATNIHIAVNKAIQKRHENSQAAVNIFENVELGLKQAVNAADSNDIIVLVGSFVIATEVLKSSYLQQLTIQESKA